MLYFAWLLFVIIITFVCLKHVEILEKQKAFKNK
ncbi:hypothetical protein HAV_00697 [Candidatus Hepatincola sp. Av]